MRRLEHARILMYSHDTFGLGHLRRCRTIAHSLVEQYRGLTVLIISGSTIAGAFDYRVRVDFVKIPSIIKLHNGEYTSIDRHTDLHETLQMRQSIIRHTAETFQPDIFIVDKEPLGLRGELEETLSFLKTHGTTLVLGLREVMDAPGLLTKEWRERDVLRKIGAFYDMIWVYGPEGFYDPLTGFEVPPSTRARMSYVGFLQRSVPHSDIPMRMPEGDYILVTTGGGGDGAELIHNVLDAYRSDNRLQHKALVVLGPFMPVRKRRKLIRKALGVPQVNMIEFDNRLETLMAGSSGVVGMGGYNTFCEILSFDKPAIIVPRLQPREEQFIRARRAAELGIIEMVLPEQAADPTIFAAALSGLPKRPPPSKSGAPVALNGLENITNLVGDWLEHSSQKRFAVVEG
ncbi:MAG: glycosyltransferase family protein [Hyphomicrobiales bacterium]